VEVCLQTVTGPRHCEVHQYPLHLRYPELTQHIPNIVNNWSSLSRKSELGSNSKSIRALSPLANIKPTLSFTLKEQSQAANINVHA
jgi:hypothetical protein